MQTPAEAMCGALALDVLAVALQQDRAQQLWLVTLTRPDGKDVARGQVRLQNVSRG